MKAWLKKNKISLLILALLTGIAVASAAFFPSTRTAGISLPAAAGTETTQDALKNYRARRDLERKNDRASLEKLLARTDIDTQTLDDAAKALARLVQWNEEELALEGALAKSRLSPCVAVRSEGMVTVVTEKEGLSEGESALLLTLCETHCGVAPSGVKVLCAEKSDT